MTDQDHPPENNIFVARQPILTRVQEVFGYELLFRSGLKNAFDPSVSGTQATSKVISSSFFLLGINKVTQGKKAFINFPEDLLREEYPLLCDRNITVVEILENVQVSDEIIHACKKFVQKGYRLALDDFVYSPALTPLLELADVVKFDVLQHDREALARQIEQVRKFNVRLLAEKVETHEDFTFTAELGFDLFQGYFFSKPNIISGKDIPASKIHLLQLLRMISDSDYDFEALSGIISQDVSLSYKLLKFVNSAWFGLPNRVESLRGAVSMLGETNLRKWLALITLSSMASDKPPELIRMAIFRAHFCGEVERSRPAAYKGDGRLYTIGMFSLLDAMLDRPMEEILSELSLSDTINNALLEKKVDIYSAPLILLHAYERGNWQVVTHLTKALGLDQKQLPAIFQASLDAAEQFESVLSS